MTSTETRQDTRGPDATTRRRELADIARRWLIRYEADGFYLDNAPRLRFLTIPQDCFALIAPGNVVRWILMSTLLGCVLWMALLAVGR